MSRRGAHCGHGGGGVPRRADGSERRLRTSNRTWKLAQSTVAGNRQWLNWLDGLLGGTGVVLHLWLWDLLLRAGTAGVAATAVHQAVVQTVSCAVHTSS